MTNAERFEQALRSILSTPPEKVEEINRQVEADYKAFGRQEVKEARAAARRSRKSKR